MVNNNILFFSEDVNYIIREKNRIRSWLTIMIKKEKRKAGNISIIMCSDSYLLKINKLYLKKNNLTDVITFNYNDPNLISGDTFISIERVKENAKKFKVSVYEELLRVIVHGTLHLCGYDDKDEIEKSQMRKKEDYYLNLF